MTTFPDLYLSFEDGMIPEVRCSHCDEFLGRIEMLSQSTDGGVAVRRREIEGELRLLLDQHRRRCQGAPAVAR